jgi:hypothetical protein
MTPLYKKIAVPNLERLQQALLSAIPDDVVCNPRVYFSEEQDKFRSIKELQDLLDSFNMDYDKTFVGYFVCPPHVPGLLHIDFGPVEYSMNIPLKNCDNTFTHFYKTDKEPILVPGRIFNGVTYHSHYSFAGIKSEVLESFESNIPFIMHIKTPHNVTNNTDNLRINALIRYADNDHMRNILSV